MLYLTRKIGESVIINDNIEVTVIDIRGKSIKLGFTFPPEAKVLRREIFDRIRAENEKAGLERDIPQAMKIHGRNREAAAPAGKTESGENQRKEAKSPAASRTREPEKTE